MSNKERIEAALEVQRERLREEATRITRAALIAAEDTSFEIIDQNKGKAPLTFKSVTPPEKEGETKRTAELRLLFRANFHKMIGEEDD